MKKTLKLNKSGFRNSDFVSAAFCVYVIFTIIFLLYSRHERIQGASHLIASLPTPYNQLKEFLVSNSDGMDPNQPHYTKLLQDYRVKTVIEVGSYFGRSTILFAKALPENGKVYAVDLWKIPDAHAHLYDKLDADLYDHFLSNIIHARLTHKIIPLRKSSLEAAKILKVKPDLVYIDATHTYEAVTEDLNAWYPFVKGHGVICGDDFNLAHGGPGDRGVGQAVIDFCTKHNLKHKVTNGRFWYIVDQKSK